MADRRTGPNPTRRSALAALMAVAVFAVAACGSASKPTRGGTSATTTPTGIAPGAVVVQVSEGGGFIDPRFAVQRVPSVTVLGDGSVITPAAVPAIYPGPAIAPLLLGHISPARVGQLVADARRLGLLGHPIDFGRPGISDVGTTTVRINDGTRIVVQSAYALGNETSSSTLTAPQRAARHALQSFVNELQSIGAGRLTYTPRAVAVFTFTGAVAPPAPVQAPKPWPITTRPARPGRGQAGCVIVKGAEVGPLLAALARANENTPWQVGAQTLTLGFRPLVPGDPGCTN